MELIQQTLSGTANFSNTVRCKISRSGDLLHNVWVNAKLPKLAGALTAAEFDGRVGTNIDAQAQVSYCNRVGFRLLKSVELRIGGQQIDKHSSTWMHLWTELSTPVEKKGEGGLNDLVGPNGTKQSLHIHAGDAQDTNNQGPLSLNSLGVQGNGSSCASQSSNGILTNTINGVAQSTLGINSNNKTGSNNGLEVWVPLQFSFCRNPGLALPLIALQYHEVELVIELETFQNCLAHGTYNPRALAVTASAEAGIVAGTADSLNDTLSVWGNYIFLDTDERKNFAQNSHEYLIETVQEQTTASVVGRNNTRLNFNHPVKELVWVARPENPTVTPFLADISPLAAADTIEMSTINLNQLNRATIEALTEIKDIDYGVAKTDVLPTVLKGVLGNAGEKNTAETGNFYGGDIFTDFTTGGRTVYLHPTTVGVTKSIKTEGVGVVVLAHGTVALKQQEPGVTSAAGQGDDLDNANQKHIDTSTIGSRHNIGPFCLAGKSSNIKSSLLKLNGQERFSQRTASYFNRVQPYQHHSGTPDLGICSYSFALKPEEHQPSGTCNFSRIDNAELIVDVETKGTIDVYAIGYNVLRVQSGMGGLAYSN
jgi:hypothetical protein